MATANGDYNFFTLTPDGSLHQVLTVIRNASGHYFQLEDPSAANSNTTIRIDNIKSISGQGDIIATMRANFSYMEPADGSMIPIGVASLAPNNSEELTIGGENMYSVWDIYTNLTYFETKIFVDRAPQGAQLGVVNGTVVVVYPGSDAFNAANTNFNLTLVRVTSDVTTV